MPKRVRKKLKITCTSTDCGSGLHCFKATRKMKALNQEGRCRECGIELVDWGRVHQRDITDARHTFESLKYELFRHHYWHREIDQRAVNHARRKGWKGLERAVARRLATSIGPADHPLDGRQTPLEDNSIFYAQHAVACCCRKCLEYWHGIPKERALDGDELHYLGDLCMLYLRERLPQLTEDGEKVPPIRRRPSRKDRVRGS